MISPCQHRASPWVFPAHMHSAGISQNRQNAYLFYTSIATYVSKKGFLALETLHVMPDMLYLFST